VKHIEHFMPEFRARLQIASIPHRSKRKPSKAAASVPPEPPVRAQNVARSTANIPKAAQVSADVPASFPQPIRYVIEGMEPMSGVEPLTY